MQKRLFLHTVLALSASAGLATAHTQAHAATPLKFQLDWRFEGPAAFFPQPVAKGYFKDAGLMSRSMPAAARAAWCSAWPRAPMTWALPISRR